MRVARDEDRQRTRVIVWSDRSVSDLDVFIVALLAPCVCIVGIVVASEYAGIVRIVGIATAAIGGLYALTNTVPLFVSFTVVRLFDRLISHLK